MDMERALTIIQALADGYDPRTGEMFPVDSPYQFGDVVRALQIAVSSVERQAQYERKRAMTRPASGTAWTQSEEEQLLKLFHEGRTTREMADIHKRSMTAISARLTKLGLIDEATTWYVSGKVD